MKSRIWLCVLLTVLASGCATTEKRDLNTRKGEVYLDAGTQSLIAGRYTDALSSLLNASKLLPENPSAWNNLGLAYYHKGDLERAEQSWKKAIAVDKTFTDARNNLGAFYLSQKRYAEAEAELKEAIKDLAYLKSHQVHYNLGLTYASQRKNLLAEQQFKLAVQANDNYCVAWYKLGQLQKQRGEFTEAAKSIKNSVSGPCFNNPEAHYEISNLYLKAREYSLAKNKLLEIIQLFPESDWARKAEVTLNLIR